MPSDAYYELLHMLDMEEAIKGNNLHVEIFKRFGQELKVDKQIYWEHLEYKVPTTREEVLTELDDILKE